MKELIIFIDIIILAPLLIFSVYLALLTALALFKGSKSTIGEQKEYRRLAVIVPAHNEESVIERTLQSLNTIKYPKGFFDIVVVADNCTDRTATLAKWSGAIVMERFDSTLIGKGYALRWCFNQLLNKEPSYDAFVIIDADTYVSENLLIVMNSYLAGGAECVQCSDVIVPQPGSWSPEMTRVAFLLHNYVRPLGRMAVGLSSGLNGNGACFSAELLTKIPWESYSRVEDLEHSIVLALKGIRIKFAHEAEVRAVMPADAHNAETQRKRWEMARFPLIKKYSGSLLSTALKQRSFATLDILIDLMMPAFANMFVITLAILVVNLFVNLAGAVWLSSVTLIWSTTLLLQLFHIFGGMRVAKADRHAYVALVSFPKYVIWKLRLYFKTWLHGDDKNWIRTARENDR